MLSMLSLYMHIIYIYVYIILYYIIIYYIILYSIIFYYIILYYIKYIHIQSTYLMTYLYWYIFVGMRGFHLLNPCGNVLDLLLRESYKTFYSLGNKITDM